jgi:chromosome segregation ATPase
MLLWEKKVQLEKETQAALDPQVGLSEVHAMEKEIHRMTLRASTLKGEKERLIKEIERGVHKRETLSLRYKAAPKPSKAASGGKKKEKAEMTKASLTKKLTALKKTVRTSANSVSEYDNAIAERKENLEVMTAQLEELTAKYGAAEETANELQNEINAQLYEKQRTAELATKRQGMVKRYQALENGLRAEVTESDMALVEGRLTETQGQLEAVRNIVTHLSENFQHLDEVLGRVMQLAADE